MEKSLQRYLRWHKANGHSPKTIHWHTQTIEAFICYLREHSYSTDIEELHIEAVREWVAEQQERELSPHTIATRVRSLRAFTRWLLEEEWIDRDPLKRLRAPKAEEKPKEILTPADVDSLLAVCGKDTANGLRDRALILALYSTGLRATELVSLRLEDLDYDRGLITIRKGKGGKFRLVPLGPKVEKAIARYLARRQGKEDNSYLFLSDEGQPLSYVALRQILRRRGAKAGIRCHAHQFRHSFAVAYLRNGGRLETLRAIMGHSAYELTLHYARLAGVDLAAAHDTADPTRSLKAR
jgi:site-specific recombinase XerD